MVNTEYDLRVKLNIDMAYNRQYYKVFRNPLSLKWQYRLKRFLPLNIVLSFAIPIIYPAWTNGLLYLFTLPRIKIAKYWYKNGFELWFIAKKRH